MSSDPSLEDLVARLMDPEGAEERLLVSSMARSPVFIIDAAAGRVSLQAPRLGLPGLSDMEVLRRCVELARTTGGLEVCLEASDETERALERLIGTKILLSSDRSVEAFTLIAESHRRENTIAATISGRTAELLQRRRR